MCNIGIIINIYMIFFSSFQQSYLWLPLLGLVVGIMASMIGSGGGLFFPLTLILLFQVPSHIAIGDTWLRTLVCGTTMY